MTTTVKLEGFDELERALVNDLPKATARTVLIRTAMKATDRLRNRMAELAPKDDGTLAQSVQTQRVKARRQPGETRYAASNGVEVWTGPGPRGKINRSNANWQEFGTVRMAPNSYVRPALDTEGMGVIGDARDILATEIGKAKDRIARKLARKGL